MKKIAILGCGWLGKALAKTLLEQGYSVCGTTTRLEHFRALQQIGVEPHCIRFENEKIKGNISSILEASDIVITAFPPGIRHTPEANYAARIQHIMAAMVQNPICKILHLSSIGVFDESQGEVIETSIPQPKTHVGKQLLKAELEVQQNQHATIVRLGGLVGEGRHPAKNLAGKKQLPSPEALTNLVHQKDVVAFLFHIIDGNHWGHILHCVSPIHHKRETFYTSECEQNGLELPEFSPDDHAKTKKVTDTKSTPLFGFHYQLPECRLKDC